MCFCCSAFGAKAQEADSLKTKVEYPTVKLDSLTMKYIDAIYNKVTESKPRYKLYQTENTYNLLKLDTGTGRVWLVQYRLGDVAAMTTAIDDTSLLWEDEEIKTGRFELYPTKNMYQFILLDTDSGRTWQIQWSTKPQQRFRERLY